MRFPYFDPFFKEFTCQYFIFFPAVIPYLPQFYKFKCFTCQDIKLYNKITRWYFLLQIKT